ncbi:MAG: hypothetical protein JWO67_2577 [Streptosporangiaceae bacterium]|nr:hypothetical protein [Streptosporangiaceae bacterium]
MPALNGQIIMTLTNAQGQPYIVATWFWTPATGALRDGTYVTSLGSKTGALIVDNLSGKSQKVVVRDAAGAVLRTVSVPTNGFTGTVAQLAAVPAPNGPITNQQQLNGLTFDLV